MVLMVADGYWIWYHVTSKLQSFKLQRSTFNSESMTCSMIDTVHPNSEGQSTHEDATQEALDRYFSSTTITQ